MGGLAHVVWGPVRGPGPRCRAFAGTDGFGKIFTRGVECGMRTQGSGTGQVVKLLAEERPETWSLGSGTDTPRAREVARAEIAVLAFRDQPAGQS